MLDLFIFALKTSHSSQKANASRFPVAVMRMSHALERVSILEVNPASQQRDTPTLHGQLFGWLLVISIP